MGGVAPQVQETQEKLMTTFPDANALARASWILAQETLRHLVQSGLIIPKDAQKILADCCAFYEGSTTISDKNALAFLKEEARKTVR